MFHCEKIKLSVLFACALLFSACAGPSYKYRKEISLLAKKGDFYLASEQIQKNEKKQYGNKNRLLYYLDYGAMLHYDGKYKESDKAFAKAEEISEELITKSATRGLGTLLINDNTTEYAGENYEKVYINVFRALNFAYLGDMEGALVEARKITAQLMRLGDKGAGFSNDGFAQYLSAIIFAENNKPDDARIAYEHSKSALDMPAKLENGKGQLVFIHYVGASPLKKSKTFQVAWNNALIYARDSRNTTAEEIQQIENALAAGVSAKSITIAYPEFDDVSWDINSSSVSALGKTAEAVEVSDLASVARMELERKKTAQLGRMIARAVLKYALVKAVDDYTDKKSGKNKRSFADILASMFVSATEIADTRSWFSLPAEIRIAFLDLPPGKHDIRVTFTNKQGNLAGGTILRDIEIKKNKRTFAGLRSAW